MVLKFPLTRFHPVKLCWGFKVMMLYPLLLLLYTCTHTHTHTHTLTKHASFLQANLPIGTSCSKCCLLSAHWSPASLTAISSSSCCVRVFVCECVFVCVCLFCSHTVSLHKMSNLTYLCVCRCRLHIGPHLCAAVYVPLCVCVCVSVCVCVTGQMFIRPADQWPY